MLILEILYNVWMGGTLIFVFNALSRCIFGNPHYKKNIKLFFLTSLFASVWPLAIISPEGRSALLGNLHKL
jgi:hypothetical protein